MAQGELNSRQKMINLMYLVLTAMLALNVSNEVLDAFVGIDNGLSHSIDIIAKDNTERFAGFDAAAENSSAEKVKPWKDKAKRVQEMTNEVDSYIQGLKRELVEYADGKKSLAITENGIDASKLDNKDGTDPGTRLLYGSEEKHGKGYELQEKINNYKETLISIANETENGKSIAATIEKMLETKGKGPVGVDEWNRDWVYSTFANVPVISVLATLSKIQLDVRNSEAQMTNYLLGQIDASSFKFSKLQAAVIPNSSYILKGSPFEAKIFLAAYDPSVHPTAVIGGTTHEADDMGQINYKAVCNSVGSFTFKGIVEYPGPDGIEKVPFEFPYQVGEAAAVVSPTKMNVFYMGIENPVDISVSGVPQSSISATCSGGTLTKNGGSYVVLPTALGKCTISLTAEVNGVKQSFGSKEFRVKKLPTPVARVSGFSSKNISKGELTSAQGLIAKMPDDFEFDLKYQVTSFRVNAAGSGGYEKEAASNQAYFSSEQKAIFNGLRSGQRVFITDIKAKGPGGEVELPTLDLKIK